MEKIKILFMGTDEVAVPSLHILDQLPPYKILAVYTQPDRKIGRKQVKQFSPIKIEAIKLNILVHQPEKIAKAEEQIRKFHPDFIVACSYGQFLPESILKIPKYGCINIHFSLLPQYRGASPVQSAILAGESESGISFFKMVKKMDAGPIYLIKREKIKDNETSEDVLKRFSQIAACFLPEVLRQVKDGYLTPILQNDEKAIFCKILNRENGKIDWKNNDSKQIFDQIRAFDPWPGTFTFFKNKRLKLINATDDSTINENKPGKVVEIGGKIGVACKRGVIFPLNVQLEGKKVMSLAEFARGYNDFIGSKLI